MKAVITARNIYKSYPHQGEVLRGVDITVHPGEFVAVMGPSGCGKSTLLHLLGLLHSPDSGSLDILGQNVRGLSQDQATVFRRNSMGFILQSNNMFPHTTVYENIEFPLIYRCMPRRLRAGRIKKALEDINLGAKMNAWSNSLSGGEQQRVAIARALVNEPQILLADEPTGALDAQNSHALMKLFCTICHKGMVAIVMVTHDPAMAAYCDSVYTLAEGRIVSAHSHTEQAGSTFVQHFA